MLSAFTLALSDIVYPPLRRVLVLGLVGAVAVLIALSVGLGFGIDRLASFDLWWVNRLIDLLGGLAVIVLAWLLFPAVVTLVLGFFLDGAIASVEARRYPGLPPPRRQSFGEILRSGVRLALLGIAVNLLALPLYLLLPGLNIVLFYALNGWLLGREYFELVALRRLDERELRAAWRAHWPRLLAGGVLIAVLLTVPVVNLAAPLIAAIFMLHLFENLPQRLGENRRAR
jgi:CysZ protein